MNARQIRRTCSLLVEQGHLEASLVSTILVRWRDLALAEATADFPETLVKLGFVTTAQLPDVRLACSAATCARPRTGAPRVYKVPEPAFVKPEGFARYEILEELQRGGMGVVLRARHRALGNEVALKVLLAPANSEEARARFRQEARLLAKLHHPNIVGVSDLGEENGRQFYVMDLVHGRNLFQIREAEGKLGVDWSVCVVREIAQAIDYCHRNGVVHRDVKPMNIIVEQEKGVPILVDFGIARCDASRLSPDEGTALLSELSEADDDLLTEVEGAGGALSRPFLTGTGHLVGTPHYMAPEQVSADLGEAGPRSDIYSLAATFYFMLTGRPPFEGRYLLQLLTDVVNREPKPIRALNPAIPPAVAKVCHLALSKDPRDRPASAVLFADALVRALEEKRPRPSAASGRLRPSYPKAVAKEDGARLQLKWAVVSVPQELPEGAAELTESSCESLVELVPSEYKVHMRRGTRRFKRGDFVGAIEELNKAIWMWPESPVAFVNRGAAYYKQKELALAIDDFTAALGFDPNNVDAYRRRARAQFKARNFERAVADFGEVIRLVPTDADAFRKRAVAHHRLGEADKAAVDEAQAALVEAPPSEDAPPIDPSDEDGPVADLPVIEVEPDPVTVVTIEGTLDHRGSGALEELFQRLLLDGHARILVDCNGLSYVSSRSATVFLSQLKTLRLAGGDLKLWGLTGRARTIFQTLGLTELLHLDFPDQNAALLAFEQPLPQEWLDALREGCVGLLSSQEFHRPTCPAVKEQDPAFQLWFETEDEAVLAGRSRCPECE